MWSIYYHRECGAEEETSRPSCGVMLRNFYIGAEGMVCPCMGMADCGFAEHFPNLFRTPLSEILNSEEFTHWCLATVGEIRDRNPKCRECRFVDRCTGGCRNAALMAGDDYFAVDPDVCWFFENHGEERITAAAQAPFEAYIKRHPPKTEREGKGVRTDVEDCP